MSLESAYNTIEKLVEDFKANERHYLAQDYSESQARLDFIDKFFIALGWDVSHTEQKNPYEQEVKVERIVRDKDAQKRADYAFFLKPNYRDPKFYVEAKKPSRSLANANDYFQAIRYGWNAQTPLVVLTDFEELHIIDSRYKPNIKTSLNCKVKNFQYSEYTNKDKFSEIYYLFSREAVESGSIEKYSAQMPKPKGKAVQKGMHGSAFQSIDEAFLEELDEIRNTLARSFKKKNPALSSEELTEATQRTIDRLVFIRFLEDMLIEGEHHISSYGDKGTAWGDFINDSKILNAKYNGVVFKEHFIDRVNIPPLLKGGQSASQMREGGSVFNPPEDKDFADICEELSHVNSPYNFNTIPIHILGSIYERFLGKVVHATEKRVTIEEKPEVRKAGGVYYTPQYIVQYIVENTVGKLIEGKSPKEIAKLRFADISCGSGSFLITVYDTLLRYYSKYYQLNPKEAKDDGCLNSNGLWVLSLKQKREILINNVYGVDIDHQAVEVTQLSLYLKLLEDETLATANEMQALFKEKILPDLSKNIICGNSLIGTDIFTNDTPLLGKTGWTEEEEKKINAMNYEDAFPHIFKSPPLKGGVSAGQGGQGGFDAIVGNPPYVKYENLDNNLQEYAKKTFVTAKSFFDLYQLFIEKSIKLFKQNSMLGYIIPSIFLKGMNYANSRKYIYENCKINIIKNYGDKVFEKVQMPTFVIILQKGFEKSHKIHYSNKSENFNEHVFEQLEFGSNNYEFVLPNLTNRIAKDNKLFGEINIQITRGIEIGKDKVIGKNNNIGIPILFGEDISRYIVKKISFISIDVFNNFKKAEIVFKGLKIVIRETGSRITSTLDDTNVITNRSLYCIKSEIINLKYLLGIINSSLIQYYYVSKFKTDTNIFPKIRIGQVKLLPIKMVNMRVIEEKLKHDKIVDFVDQILEAKKQLANVVTDKDKNFYESKCNTLDRQIDRLVYELYGLTDDEIKIVEGE